jgi:hypothetical protein
MMALDIVDADTVGLGVSGLEMIQDADELHVVSEDFVEKIINVHPYHLAEEVAKLDYKSQPKPRGPMFNSRKGGRRRW